MKICSRAAMKSREPVVTQALFQRQTLLCDLFTVASVAQSRPLADWLSHLIHPNQIHAERRQPYRDHSHRLPRRQLADTPQRLVHAFIYGIKDLVDLDAACRGSHCIQLDRVTFYLPYEIAVPIETRRRRIRTARYFKCRAPNARATHIHREDCVDGVPARHSGQLLMLMTLAFTGIRPSCHLTTSGMAQPHQPRSPFSPPLTRPQAFAPSGSHLTHHITPVPSHAHITSVQPSVTLSLAQQRFEKLPS